MTSLCDARSKPGQCCKDFNLGGGTFWIDGDYTVQKFLNDNNLPFEPRMTGEYKDDVSGDMYASYTYSCPKLTDDGRCSIYANRPDLCRRYKPGQDALCVYYKAENG